MAKGKAKNDLKEEKKAVEETKEVKTEDKNEVKEEKIEPKTQEKEVKSKAEVIQAVPKAKKSTSSFSDMFFILFIYLNVIHALGALINHIDDTDETYGYWEPLHYLLYGKGMQTWEYSPDYAIRSYAFIYPFYLIGKVLTYFNIHKLRVFYAIRGAIGMFTATGEVSLVYAIHKRYDNELLNFFLVAFLVCSSGIFFAGTAFLPSAISSSLLMHCYSQWLMERYYLAIFWGSIAVLWTGWPFVAVLLVPLGLHMVVDTFIKGKKNGTGISKVFQFLFAGLCIAFLVFVPAFVLDVQYYGKWTCPTINIALYNAFGGTGDELYGVEPLTYYIKNLFLNVGVTWPLAILWPIATAMKESLCQPTPEEKKTNEKDTEKKPKGLIDEFVLTIVSAAFLWLMTLFSRPHKEERFMYPVYPLLCVVAAISAVHISDSVTKIVSNVTSNAKILDFFQTLVVGVLMGTAIVLFLGRLGASYRNYSGYMRIWKDTGLHLYFTHRYPANVCVGSEWYQFPSHFFLPENATLAFVEDGFHGILPQLYAPIDGTSAKPLQPFNDVNREEFSRYIDPSSCAFYVGSSIPVQFSESSKNDEDSSPGTCKLFLEPDFIQPIVTGTKGDGLKSLGKAYFLPFQPRDSLIYTNYTMSRVVPSDVSCLVVD